MAAEVEFPRDDAALGSDATHQQLNRTWSNSPGLIGWLSVVDHKIIGYRSIIAAVGFFTAGGLLALVMRAQLAHADNHLVDPDLYNQLFSMHGSTMMFLFAVPVMQALGVYLVPLMVGTRAIAFPRLNAFAFW